MSIYKIALQFKNILLLFLENTIKIFIDLFQAALLSTRVSFLFILHLSIRPKNLSNQISVKNDYFKNK